MHLSKTYYWGDSLAHPNLRRPARPADQTSAGFGAGGRREPYPAEPPHNDKHKIAMILDVIQIDDSDLDQ
jgi:hypothetical protein